MKHSRRFACDLCGTTGKLPDEEMSSGWKQCGGCMGHGWVDETPEPPNTPHPDPEAPIESRVFRPCYPPNATFCGSDPWAN